MSIRVLSRASSDSGKSDGDDALECDERLTLDFGNYCHVACVAEILGLNRRKKQPWMEHQGGRTAAVVHAKIDQSQSTKSLHAHRSVGQYGIGGEHTLVKDVTQAFGVQRCIITLAIREHLKAHSRWNFIVSWKIWIVTFVIS
jgi:hypothetical protein